MKSLHRFAVAAVLVAVAALVGVLAAPSLPERLVTHWNAAGEPDGSMAKPLALAFLPALAAGLLALFAVLPRIDPLGENVAAFRASYDRFVVVLVGFLSLLHVGIVAFNLGYEFPFASLVVAGAAGLVYAVGALLERAERNWFVGIRTPWTLSSDAVWDRTHDLGGTLFKLSALVALGGVLAGEYAIYFLVVPLALTAAITAAYSYYAYRRLADGGAEAADPGL